MRFVFTRGENLSFREISVCFSLRLPCLEEDVESRVAREMLMLMHVASK